MAPLSTPLADHTSMLGPGIKSGRQRGMLSMQDDSRSDTALLHTPRTTSQERHKRRISSPSASSTKRLSINEEGASLLIGSLIILLQRLFEKSRPNHGDIKLKI